MTDDPSPLDRILSATLPGGLAVATAVRQSILRAIRGHRYETPARMIAAVRDALHRAVPLLADSFRDSLLASWIGAAHFTAIDAFADGSDADFGEILPLASGGELARRESGGTDGTEELNFAVHFTAPPRSPRPPILKEAHYLFTDRGFDWLNSRKLVSSSHFRDLDHAARQQSEVIAHATSEATAGILVDALNESLVEPGGTLGKFQERARIALEGESPLSDWQTETLYRTNGGRAFSAGQLFALSHPLVGSEFPYVLYSATHDSRVRHEHIALEKLGLDGTAVYRADDPVIRMFWPPWSWNCRCVVIPLSVADAARYGVSEAKRWLESGREPTMPEYVKAPPFGLPNNWQPVTSAFFPAAVA